VTGIIFILFFWSSLKNFFKTKIFFLNMQTTTPKMIAWQEVGRDERAALLHELLGFYSSMMETVTREMQNTGRPASTEYWLLLFVRQLHKTLQDVRDNLTLFGGGGGSNSLTGELCDSQRHWLARLSVVKRLLCRDLHWLETCCLLPPGYVIDEALAKSLQKGEQMPMESLFFDALKEQTAAVATLYQATDAKTPMSEKTWQTLAQFESPLLQIMRTMQRKLRGSDSAEGKVDEHLQSDTQLIFYAVILCYSCFTEARLARLNMEDIQQILACIYSYPCGYHFKSLGDELYALGALLCEQQQIDDTVTFTQIRAQKDGERHVALLKSFLQLEGQTQSPHRLQQELQEVKHLSAQSPLAANVVKQHMLLQTRISMTRERVHWHVKWCCKTFQRIQCKQLPYRRRTAHWQFLASDTLRYWDDGCGCYLDGTERKALNHLARAVTMALCGLRPCDELVETRIRIRQLFCSPLIDYALIGEAIEAVMTQIVVPRGPTTGRQYCHDMSPLSVQRRSATACHTYSLYICLRDQINFLFILVDRSINRTGTHGAIFKLCHHLQASQHQ
jgi:hypothetical protein